MNYICYTFPKLSRHFYSGDDAFLLDKFAGWAEVVNVVKGSEEVYRCTAAASTK